MTPEQRTADIKNRKHAAGDGASPVSHKIWIRGGWKYHPVWAVPIEDLALNVDNKRFTSERELVEYALGRPLDPTNNPTDEASIISILCDSSIDVDLEREVAIGTPSKDYAALRDDWMERGQEEPFWIRPDGTVRNGNRRLAMLRRVRDEGTVVDWVDAIILTLDDVDESELFRMEQKEQLTENFKKRYQDINALLALKEAAELEGINWSDPESIQTVAGRLKHQAGRDDQSYASKQLYAIRALDGYLVYINAPGRYFLARKQVEVFREVGLCMSAYEEDPDQQFELMQAAYALVQAGRKYRDIRLLRRFFGSDRHAFDAMMGRISKIERESGWDPDAVGPEVDFPDLIDATAPDPDEEGEEDDLAPVVGPANYPRVPVSDVIDEAFERFSATALGVQKQLKLALARLEAVDMNSLSLTPDEVKVEIRGAVEAVAQWAGRALQELE